MLCLCLMGSSIFLSEQLYLIELLNCARSSHITHTQEEAVRTAALPKAALELGKGKYHMHAIGRYSYGRLNIGFKIV